MKKLVSLATLIILSIQLSACMPSLHRAASAGDTNAVKALLDKGIDVNLRDTWRPGLTPLHDAARQDKVEVVKLLLDRGADIDDRSFGHHTPLNYAISERSLATAKLLIERGANVDLAMAAIDACGESCGGSATLLKGLARQRQPAEAGISREDISTIVQATLAGAAKAQEKGVEHAKALESDMDRPAYKLAERPDDFALVVGIGKYSDLPEAQFAERDAEAVKDHLIAAGFPSRNVIQLFGEKAGRSALEKFLETWLPRNVNENSRVFFYFSGHGAPDPKTGEAYLIPWDGDPGFLENTGYPIKRLYEKLSSLKAKEVVVAMDACFSGAGGRSVLAKGARPLVMKTDATVAPQNITVFAAASGDQITSTLEDQGHGTFTYYFLKGLSGGAKDTSGRVTTQALFDYLKPKVQDAARRQNRDQEPVLYSQGDRELVRF